MGVTSQVHRSRASVEQDGATHIGAAPAAGLGSIEDDHGVAGPAQQLRCGKTGEAGAHDDDVGADGSIEVAHAVPTSGSPKT
jgi:hypothetical protein